MQRTQVIVGPNLVRLGSSFLLPSQVPHLRATLRELTTYFSSFPPLVRVLDLSEGENLVGRWLLNVLDPAAIVVSSVAAATRDVVVDGAERRQLNAVNVAGRCYEDGAVKFAVSTALAIEGGCAVSDDENNPVPTGVAVVMEVAGDHQQPISGVRAQVEAAVHVNRLGIRCRHSGPSVARSGLAEIVSGAAVVVVLRIRRVRNNHVRVRLYVVDQLVQRRR